MDNEKQDMSAEADVSVDPQATERKNSAVDSVHVGDVWVNIFAFKDKKGKPYHRFTASRTYRDNKGAWKRTGFFGPEDVANLENASKEAVTRINAMKQPA